MLVSCLVIAAIFFLVLGVIVCGLGIADEVYENVPIGIVSILIGLLLIGAAVSKSSSSGTDESVLKEEAFLAPVSDDCYLLEGETNYIYQEKSPSGTLEPEMLQNDKHTQIEVKAIASTEEPYVLKYERTVDGDEECKYVFYIPQS